MDGDQQSRETLEAEAKLRFARVMLTGCLWPLIRGIFYGLGVVAVLITISREIASRAG